MKVRMPLDIAVGSKFQSNNFGDFVIVDYLGTHNVIVRFKTGYTTSVSAFHVRNGRVKDKIMPIVCGVGFIGDGAYMAKENGKESCVYSIWKAMLSRCYSKNTLINRPTYIDCTVCVEWHNFQDFAKWYNENHPSDELKYDLDKDIKVDGNKIYSPETCMFVTPEENTIKAWARNFTFRSPSGEVVEIYNLNKFCIDNSLQQSHMSGVANGRRNHHKGWTKP